MYTCNRRRAIKLIPVDTKGNWARPPEDILRLVESKEIGVAIGKCLETLPTTQREGIVKVRGISPLSRRKRSVLERRFNNLETAMKRSQGAQTVNLTVPYFVIAEQDGDVYVEMRSLSLSNALPSGLGFLQSILIKLPRQTVINTLEVTRAALKGKR